MQRNDLGQAMSDSQRAFVDAAEALDARSSATARPLAELPRITAKAIEELLDAGLVREGAPGTYYVYERTRRAAAATEVVAPGTASSDSWRVLTVRLAVWLLLILVPFIFIRLTK